MSIILLFIWLMFGLICREMAKKRGRNPTIGFVVGFLLGIIGILYYLIAGKSKKLKEA